MHDETFVVKQVEYLLDNDWIPVIEHTERLDAFPADWESWDCSLSPAHQADTVLAELHACRETHPRSYIRIAGYDPAQHSQVMDFMAVHP